MNFVVAVLLLVVDEETAFWSASPPCNRPAPPRTPAHPRAPPRAPARPMRASPQLGVRCAPRLQPRTPLSRCLAAVVERILPGHFARDMAMSLVDHGV